MREKSCWFVVGALMSFAVLQKIADRIKWKTKIFMYLSSQSMIVFLLHQQILYFFISGLNGKVDPYLNALINFIGAIGL